MIMVTIMILELLNNYSVSGPVLNIFVILSHLLLMTVCEIGSFHTAKTEKGGKDRGKEIHRHV